MKRCELEIYNLISENDSWNLIKGYLKNKNITDEKIKKSLKALIDMDDGLNNENFSLNTLLHDTDFLKKLDELDNKKPLNKFNYAFQLFERVLDSSSEYNDNKYLWLRLARMFSSYELPVNEAKFRMDFLEKFYELTQINLNLLDEYSSSNIVYIKSLDINGLSKGKIVPQFFIDRLEYTILYIYALNNDIDIVMVKDIFKAINLINKGFSPNSVLFKYYDNEEFLQLLYRTADGYLRDAMHNSNTITKNKKLIIFLALIMISFKKYNSSIVPHVRETFYESYKNESKAIETLRNIIRNSDLSFPRLLLEKGIAYAGVTEYWMPSFFDFCADIFEHNLLLQTDLSDNYIEDELKFVFSSLKASNSLSEENDAVNVLGKNKSYKLSKYTQTLLKDEKEDWYPVINIAKNCIKIIAGQIEPPSSLYIKSYQTWIDKNEVAYNYKRVNNNKVYNPFYSIDNSLKVYINTSTMRISDEYNDLNRLSFSVNNDNTTILRNKNISILDSEVVGGYVINSTKFEVKDPLNKVSYALEYTDNDESQELYNTGERLYRDNIFFDPNNFREIKPGKYYEGMAFLVTKFDVEFGILLDNNDFFNVYQVEINPNQTYVINELVYTFREKKKLILTGEVIPEIKYVFEEKEYPVYKSIDSLVSDLSDVKENDYFIYDEVSKKILYNESETKNLNTGINIKKLDSGFYKLVIGSKKSRQKVKDLEAISFVYDPNIDISYSKVSNNKYICLINSNLGHLLQTIEDLTVCDFSVDISYSNTNGKFSVFFKIPMVSLDGISWIDELERISYDSLKENNFKMYIKGMEKCELYDEYSGYKIPLKSDENHKLYFDTKYFMNFSNNKPRKVTIRNESESISFFLDYVTYFPKQYFHFFINSKGIPTIKLDFIPKVDTKIKIVLGQTVKLKTLLTPNFQYEINGMVPFAEYKVYIEEMRGFTPIDIYKEIIQYCTKDNLFNRKFLIDTVIIKSPFGEKYAYQKVGEVSIKVLEKLYRDNYKVSIMELDNRHRRFYGIKMITDYEFEDDLIKVKLTHKNNAFVYDHKTKSIDLIDKNKIENKIAIIDFILKLKG